ncbi:MAG: hypothetical protein EZS28_040056, partial [Streblomastix strix]
QKAIEGICNRQVAQQCQRYSYESLEDTLAYDQGSCGEDGLRKRSEYSVEYGQRPSRIGSESKQLNGRDHGSLKNIQQEKDLDGSGFHKSGQRSELRQPDQLVEGNVLQRKICTAGPLQDIKSQQRRSGMLKDRNNSNTQAVWLEDIRKEISAKFPLNPIVLGEEQNDKSDKKLELDCLEDDEFESMRIGKLHRSIKLLQAVDTKMWPSYEEAEQGQIVCLFKKTLEQQSLLEQRYHLRDIQMEKAD